MHALWPELHHDVDVRHEVAREQRPPPKDRPWVTMVMIASLDGAASVDGLSGGLGRPADKAVFGALRAAADAIVVAGRTAMAEDYGPPLPLRPHEQEQRRSEGRADRPRLAVMSGSLPFTPDQRLFSDAEQPPLIYTRTTTPAADQDRVAAMGAEVIAGEPDAAGHVSPESVVADLHRRGLHHIMLEGGPTLNTSFLAAGLVDEIHLSLAPLVVGGASRRIAGGPSGEPAFAPIDFDLVRVWSGDGLLFLRYLRHLDEAGNAG